MPLRLPKHHTVPGIEELQLLWTQAHRARGRQVEFPWTTPGRVHYRMTLICESGAEPAWVLFKGEGATASVVWSYATGDIGLIFNLVVSECGAELSAMHSNTYVSAQSTTLSSAGSGTYNVVSPSQEVTSGGIARSQSKSILEGDLRNMQLQNLLQSIALSKLTGRLEVLGGSAVAEVFVVDGVPVHARLREQTGDLAIMELLLWEDGEFHFYDQEKCEERTVKKRLDAMLMEGVALLDQHRYVTGEGLKLESYLLRKNPNLTEAEFEQKVASGAPLDMGTQKKFYQAIDGKSTLLEILRRFPLGKTEWLPIMFNMLSCKLVMLSDTQPKGLERRALESTGIDRTSIAGVLKNLTRPETGLITYPAFLYFLEQEYLRYEAFGQPLTLVMFDMRVRSLGPDSDPVPLPLVAVREAVRRLSATKRQVDLLCHYQTFEYGLILPNTNSQAAGVVVSRMAELLVSKPLIADLDPRAVCLAFGAASIPETCQSLGQLLSAARESMNEAKRTASPVVWFQNIR